MSTAATPSVGIGIFANGSGCTVMFPAVGTGEYQGELTEPPGAPTTPIVDPERILGFVTEIAGFEFELTAIEVVTDSWTPLERVMPIPLGAIA
jgi:hypothetical protein